MPAKKLSADEAMAKRKDQTRDVGGSLGLFKAAKAPAKKTTSAAKAPAKKVTKAAAKPAGGAFGVPSGTSRLDSSALDTSQLPPGFEKFLGK